jgi:hypothetical protein
MMKFPQFWVGLAGHGSAAYKKQIGTGLNSSPRLFLKFDKSLWRNTFCHKELSGQVIYAFDWTGEENINTWISAGCCKRQIMEVATI